jgi:FAD/FMN-containing dehydrogenase
MTKTTTTEIAGALQQVVRGSVRADERTLTRYATDQSIYRVRPQVVVYPRDLEDVVATVRYAHQYGLPLTPRGAGSGTAGAALGRGILLAFRPRPGGGLNGAMDRILDLSDVDGEPRVTVEPGLLHDDLQGHLRNSGLYLPADPSSGAICALGGNIATKASGPHALKHGSIDRYLRHVQFVTADGTVVDTADPASIPAHIRHGVTLLRDNILSDDEAVRRLETRADRKLASGYNLFTFVRDQESSTPGIDTPTIGAWVAQLLVGSVGTLGVVTRATLSAEPYVESRATTSLYFRHLHEAGDAVQHIRALGVAAIEIMNHDTIAMVVQRGRRLDVPQDRAHLLLVEYEGPERYDQIECMSRLIRENGYELAAKPVTVEDREEQARLWKVRKAVLPTIRNFDADRVALSVVNDVGVPVAHLAEAIHDLEGIFRRLGLIAAMYGHAGSGNLHLRPLFDRHDPNLPALLARVADEVYETVLRYDGTITAEHGMGRLRAPYLAREWGAAMIGYMRRVKEIFDPDDLLNPDVMFSERALTDDLGEFG